MSNQDYKVYEYIVYWQEGEYQVLSGSWKRKAFASKREARIFARNYRKNYKSKPIKPYILQHITWKSTFRQDVAVERVPEKVVKTLSTWGEYFKRIWY